MIIHNSLKLDSEIASISMPGLSVECLTANNEITAYGKRLAWVKANGGLRTGLVNYAVCGNDKCFLPEHIGWRESGNNFRHDWKVITSQVREMQEGDEITLTDIPHGKELNLLKCRLSQDRLSPHVIFRNLLGNKGTRIICTGTWYGDRREWENNFPIEDHRIGREWNTQRPGSFFLGFIRGSEMHSDEVMRRGPRCQEKGCAYPANGNGKGLCVYHNHFFDYWESFNDRSVDTSDIYANPGNERPHFSVVQVGRERSEFMYTKFEHRGIVNRGEKLSEQWFHKVEALVSAQPQVANSQWGITPPKGISTTKKIRKKQRMRPQGWHGNHPEHDVVKRWDREKLDHIAVLSPSKLNVPIEDQEEFSEGETDGETDVQFPEVTELTEAGKYAMAISDLVEEQEQFEEMWSM